jgi:uncharacterized sulfatase
MPAPRPNILLILTDQQRRDTLSCYGSSAFTQTPHLDRLASEGVRFDRAYCTNPVCTPARASIFTGLYVSRHGAWNVGMTVPPQPFVSDALTAAGYRTHNVGKAHFQAFFCDPSKSIESWQTDNPHYPDFRGPYYGFQTVELALGHSRFGLAGHYGVWVRSQVTEAEFKRFQNPPMLSEFTFGGEGYDWDLPVRLHNSTWTADRTIDFLQKHDASKQPFFLVSSFQDPHHAHTVPKDYTNRVDPAKVPLPDYVEGELNDKPPHFREAREGRLEKSDVRGDFWVAGQGPGADFRRVSERDARVGRAYYHTMVRLMDEQIGRILDCLRERNLFDDTLVIFTTDHGELLGDHGIWMKGPFHYEQLLCVPTIMSWPNGIGREGRATGAILSHVDLAPTILAATGAAAHGPMDGVDALPLMRGEVPSIRSSALIECVDDPRKLRLKTIVTRDRKLTWYCGEDFGELYDLANDPAERANRWSDPSYARDRQELLARILDTTEPLERRAPRVCYA